MCLEHSVRRNWLGGLQYTSVTPVKGGAVAMEIIFLTEAHKNIRVTSCTVILCLSAKETLIYSYTEGIL